SDLITASDSRNASAYGWRSMATSRATRPRGETRSERERPEPSSMPQPSAGTPIRARKSRAASCPVVTLPSPFARCPSSRRSISVWRFWLSLLTTLSSSKRGGLSWAARTAAAPASGSDGTLAGGEPQLHRVVVEGEGRDLGPIGPGQVLPSPVGPAPVARERPFVADHPALDPPDPRGLERVRQLLERREDVPAGGRR